jgi:hypothetical protein
MSVDDLEIDCPNCGRSLSAEASICPNCHIELSMADLDELERVSREDYVPEAPHSKFGDHGKSDAIAADDDANEGRVSFRGRFFGKGKK